jgi:hypothetical protein
VGFGSVERLPAGKSREGTQGTSVTDDGGIAGFSLTSVVIAAALAFVVSGCSEVGFPSVHDMPAPRTDTTLTPDQVKQATDDLVSERDRLNTGSVPSGQPAAPSKAAVAKNASSSVQPAAQGAAAPTPQ